MQQQVEDSERDEIFQKLKSIPENNKCFDCDKKNPKWSSVYLGLYLCLDCAGKHREYGPQISFVRSLNLDTWNRRYITFMELGGNAKALEYFKKQGVKTPYDYKSATIQKYKQELTKKADAVLGNAKPQEEAPKSVFVNRVAEDHKTQSPSLNSFGGGMLQAKSHSDKPTHGEKESDDPFANNIVINKAQVKPKAFAVDFNKGKTGNGANKGRLAAKKIDNVDLDSLTLNEDGSATKKGFDMAESPFGLTGNKNNVKEVFSKGNSPYLSEQGTDEKLKKLQNAKAISSESFKGDSPGFDPNNARKFVNSNAISSAQFFGEKEEEHDDNQLDYYQAAENLKDFYSNLGDKLKSKAEGFISKVKDEWNQ